MEPPSPSSRRWYRVAAWAAGSVLALAALAASSWPWLLEGTARKKATAVLERKFDAVEFGCFELGRAQLHICDVHLEKESVVVDLEELDIDFQVRWLERQVVVDRVVARGGTLAGTLDDIRELRGAGAREREEGAGTSAVAIEGAQLELEELAMEIDHGDFQVKATASASSPGTAGPVALEVAELEVLDGGQPLAGAGSVISELDPETPFPVTVELEGAWASREELAIRDVAGTVHLEDEALEVVEADLHGQTGEGQSWGLQGTLDRAREHVDVVLAAQGIRPSQLPGADQFPLDPASGTVSGSVALKGSRKKMSLEGELELQEVRVVHPKLARRPVVISNSLEFDGRVDLERRELVLEKASISQLEKNGWSVHLSGRLLYAEDPRKREFSLELELPTEECQRLLEGAPPGLLPALEGFELSGVTYAWLELDVKMNDPDATVLEGGLDLDACKLEKVPKTVADLSGPFSHVVKMRTGRTVSRLLGRGALYYTPYDRMPKSMPAAVLSTEDGGFWKHDGFLESQFRASLRRNVELGEFRRGASTITMQMVKNVLLTQEKTVSRKLQELFLTWVVEKQLGKKRIMEIYLNVVEFGPGIYGVGEAADHYFGKTPLELTSLESAFLATLLPRPIERHEMWCRGGLTEKHAKRIRRIHRRMLGTGRITQAAFDAAEAVPFEFSRRGWSGEAACVAEGRRVGQGAHTQGALSGLLLGRPD